MADSLTDIHSLFKRISSDDVAAYERLFHFYYDLIYSTAFKYGKTKELAEDAAQQVFLKVWERRGELRLVENPEGWLFTAARYQVLHALDKEFSKEAYLRYVKSLVAVTDISPVDEIMRKQQQELLRRAYEGLSARQLEVYRMSREQGLTYDQIAGVLGISRETVKEHMAKALKGIEGFSREK